jgi:hypothetical protein
MGPFELQLMRELAIHMVRTCARQVHAREARHEVDLASYRAWFDRTYDDWAATPRAELNGLTPTETISEERARLWRQPPVPSASAPGHIELYTDLPQADDAADQFGGDAAKPATLLPDLAARAEKIADQADEARWRAFYDRHLRNLLDER